MSRPWITKEFYANDVVTCIVKGAYNCLYVSSLKGGVKELNLTSNKLHDLLFKDETGESVFVVNCWLLLTMNFGLVQSRDFIFIISGRPNMFICAVRSMILILCPIMLFIHCARIVRGHLDWFLFRGSELLSPFLYVFRKILSQRDR